MLDKAAGCRMLSTADELENNGNVRVIFLKKTKALLVRLTN